MSQRGRIVATKGITMRLAEQSSVEDTVVIYDVMRESANRLVAKLANTSTLRGGAVEHAIVLRQIDGVRARADETPTRDHAAILEATDTFRREAQALPAA